jgi:hypothetical protein
MCESKLHRGSVLAVAAFVLAGCGAGNAPSKTQEPVIPSGTAGAQIVSPVTGDGSAGRSPTVPVQVATAGTGQAGSVALSAGTGQPPSAGAAPPIPTKPLTMPPAAGSNGSAGAAMGAAGGGSIPLAGPTPFKGMVDGDPSAPVVTVPGVTCGKGQGFGIGTPNVKITDRDVYVSYPCNKHEGAPMTFLLLLHGTMMTEAQKLYIVGYFGASSYLADHNLIIAAPKAIGSQWGNGDNGQDLPHLYDVINYVYTNFAKYNIKSMWVGGHSWGGIYAKQFVCDTMIQDKAKGVIDMSGGASAPKCTDRISQIHTIGEMELMGKADSTAFPSQSAAASAHHCDMALAGPEMIATNARYYHHSNCPAAWVHSDYVNIGKAHADFIDAPVVLHILDWIKSTEM